MICARLTWGHALGHVVIGPRPKGYKSLGGMSDPAPFLVLFGCLPIHMGCSAYAISRVDLYSCKTLARRKKVKEEGAWWNSFCGTQWSQQLYILRPFYFEGERAAQAKSTRRHAAAVSLDGGRTWAKITLTTWYTFDLLPIFGSRPPLPAVKLG